jgi:glycosyltransferase involved in cell wall biosynthesis
VTSIDILLPFYGDVGYLKLAVQSVLAQEDGEFRLIVVDDGYPDPDVAPWFRDLSDQRVTYHRNSSNLGANGNYRHALSMAEADYVVVMGADDLMLPGYVGLVRDVITDFPDVAVVQPGVRVIDEAGKPARTLADRTKALVRPRTAGRRSLSGEDLARTLLLANWTYFPSLCWNRRMITEIGFRTGLDVVQDLALLLDVTAAGGSMVVTDEVVFCYRRHRFSDSAMQAAAGTRFDEERRFFATMAEESEARGWRSAARGARWHLTSRLHSASLLVGSARPGGWKAMRPLIRHTIAW